MRAAASGLVVLALFGCGRTATFVGGLDGADAGVQAVLGRRCDQACRVVPTGTLQPTMSGVGQERTLHWKTCDGCLTVTVDSRFAATLQEVDAATKPWATSSLCFRPAMVATSNQPAKGELRLGPIGDGTTLLTSTLTFEKSTGALLSALASAREDVTLTPRVLVQLVGRGLGYRTNDGDSVMNERANTPSAGLTAGDRAVHEQMYGTAPLCER